MENIEYIKHYGVLGMKWGKRKRQETSSSPKKSKYRTNLENQYKDGGMSKKDAEIAAAKKIHTQKVLATVGGLTLAAAATYVAVRHYKDSTDKILKSGSLIQNISVDSNKGVADAFYGATSNRDKMKYRGLYGDHLSNNIFGKKDVYNTNIKVVKDVKISSHKNAQKALSEVLNSQQSRDQLSSYLMSQQGLIPPKQKNMLTRASKDLSKGKITKNVYEAFNYSLPDHKTQTMVDFKNQFYSNLSQKGYHAIPDINDVKYSGYKTKSPTIIFGGSSTTVVESITKMGSDQINRDKQKAINDITTQTAIEQGAALLVGWGVIKGTQNAISDGHKKIEEQYTTK